MQLEVQKRPTLSALTWIKRGWRVFTLSPSVFMGMAGILMVVGLLAGIIPYFNFVALLITPFLAAGFYQVASQIEQDKKATVSDIFEYFGRLGEYRIFFRVAAVTVLLSLPASTIFTDITNQLSQQQVPEFSQLALGTLFLFINFMFTAFLVQSAWVAPQSSIIELLRLSFKACWVNGLPLTVYGLFSVIVVLISFPIILVGWVIAYGALMLMFLQAFLDIYRPVQDVQAEQSTEQNTELTDNQSHEQGDNQSNDQSSELNEQGTESEAESNQALELDTASETHTKKGDE